MDPRFVDFSPWKRARSHGLSLWQLRAASLRCPEVVWILLQRDSSESQQLHVFDVLGRRPLKLRPHSAGGGGWRVVAEGCVHLGHVGVPSINFLF